MDQHCSCNNISYMNFCHSQLLEFYVGIFLTLPSVGSRQFVRSHLNDDLSEHGMQTETSIVKRTDKSCTSGNSSFIGGLNGHKMDKCFSGFIFLKFLDSWDF